MPHYQQAVDAREIAFSSLSKLVTRALNMFKASVFNQPEVESAVFVSKRIRGFKANKPKPAQEGTPVKTISTSQRSYDMLIANFQIFIEILAAHQTYQPNEEDLKITSLKQQASRFNGKKRSRHYCTNQCRHSKKP